MLRIGAEDSVEVPVGSEANAKDTEMIRLKITAAARIGVFIVSSCEDLIAAVMPACSLCKLELTVEPAGISAVLPERRLFSAGGADLTPGKLPNYIER